MGGFLSGVTSAVEHPIRTGQAIDNGAARLGHWAWYGNHPGAGLGAVPGQLAQMFDPRSKAGLANLASMFVGGPKGEDVLGQWQPAAKFEPYSLPKAAIGGHLQSNEGSPLYGVGRGTPKQIKAYNPGMDAIIKNAQRNPFVRASKAVVSREQQNALEKQSALDMMRQQAAHAMQARKQVDEHLNSAPMQAHQPAPEHDASLIHGPSVVNHPAFLRNMLQRRYQAGLGHNHLN
jgi:hypothetical protein